MTFSRQTLRRGVVWGGAALLSTGVLVYAFNPQPDPPGHYYGLMTIEAGQHVSVHVANTKMAVDSFRPSSLCSARIEVVDSCGAPLARSIARLSPGASKSLNFTMPTDQFPPDPCTEPPGPDITGGDVMGNPPDDGVPPDSGKQRVRAQVVFTGEAGHCISSVEVGQPFVGDPTGRTGGSGFIHPGLIVGFNPQPDPPGAPTKTVR